MYHSGLEHSKCPFRFLKGSEKWQGPLWSLEGFEHIVLAWPLWWIALSDSDIMLLQHDDVVCFGQLWNRPFGLVVKGSALRAEDPGFRSRLRWDFSGSGHTSDLEIGAPVATLPGDWCYTVSAGTCWLGVSILWLGEMESLICNFCLSVW